MRCCARRPAVPRPKRLVLGFGVCGVMSVAMPRPVPGSVSALPGGKHAEEFTLNTGLLPSILAAVARGLAGRGWKEPAAWVRCADLLAFLADGQSLVRLDGLTP